MGIIILFIVLLAVSLLLAGVFTIHSGFNVNLEGLSLKSVASAAFVALGFLCCRASGEAAYAVVIGLAFGLVGDIFLYLRGLYKRDSVYFTFAGFIAFLIGHVFYIIYLFDYHGFSTVGLFISLLAAVAVGFFIFFSERLMGLSYGSFKMISSVYAAFLFFLTFYSLFNTTLMGFSFAKLLFFVGNVLFLVSDLVLSKIYFADGGDVPQNRMINHALYYAGQILIASSLFAL